MALTTCTVRCALSDQNGQPLAGAVITATLNRYEVYQGHVVPRATTAVTAADGTAQLALWPNALGAVESAYEIAIQPSGGTVYRTTAVVPNLASTDLHLISELPPYPGMTNGQLLIDTAADTVTVVLAAKDTAVASANDAGMSATNAAASASSASTSASSAATSAVAAATSESNAAASASNAATSESNAATSATAAANSATAAATSATNASDTVASLAAAGGSTLVGHGSETVKAALDARLPEIGTYALLEAYTGPLTAYYVRCRAELFDGAHGVFRVIVGDTTTPANGGTILVDEIGRRWGREYSGAVNVLWFGADSSGATECATYIQAALDLKKETYVPDGIYLIGTTLLVHPGCILRGAGSGNYDSQGATDRTVTEFRVKTSTATTGIRIASKAFCRDFLIRPENHAVVTYSDADYPAATGNASYGVDVGYNAGAGSGSGRVFNVTAQGFAEAAFYLNAASHVDSCHARMSKHGFYAYGPDGWLVNSSAIHCHEAGAHLSTYWRAIGNRLEWNARYGLSAGAESTIVGNLFDRNGWAGLYLRTGLWGHAITGNYFSRNGVGGDGTKGRWDFSAPGHASYLATDKEDSCHIKLDYQRAVTIAGNRYRAGYDDSGSGGAHGPCYIYSSKALAGSTPGRAVRVAGNAGEYAPDGGIGFNAAMYSNSGAIAGGTDTSMSGHFNKVLAATGTWTVQFYDAASGGNLSPTTGTGKYVANPDGTVELFIYNINNIDTTGMTAGNVLYFTLPFASAADGASAGDVVFDSMTLPSSRTQVAAVCSINSSRGYFVATGSGQAAANLTVGAISTGVSDIVRLQMTYPV